jgi:hypothetical protein
MSGRVTASRVEPVAAVEMTDLRKAMDEFDDLPPMVRTWISQLLDPSFLALLMHAPDRIDVTLSASRGRARRSPAILLGGGASEYVG